MTQTIPADLPSLLRYIKRSLHGMMNGVASASMRQKGLQYKVNFGVELPRLQAWAAELPHTYELAAALWKEDIRECRLLAAMLMPVERFDTELAQVWWSRCALPRRPSARPCTCFAAYQAFRRKPSSG